MNFFKWLFGRKAAPVELPPEFLQENPPDWLLEFKGPDGDGMVSVRVQITQSARKAMADILVLPRREGAEPASRTTELARTELDRLLVILGFSFPADITSIDGGTEPGEPATLTIHRHEPYASKTAECDLAGWLDSRKPGPPVVELARVLMEIPRRAGAGPGGPRPLT